MERERKMKPNEKRNDITNALSKIQGALALLTEASDLMEKHGLHTAVSEIRQEIMENLRKEFDMLTIVRRNA